MLAPIFPPVRSHLAGASPVEQGCRVEQQQGHWHTHTSISLKLSFEQYPVALLCSRW